MKQITVRLPDDLHKRLETQAKAEHRSVNNLIEVLVEQHLLPHKATMP